MRLVNLKLSIAFWTANLKFTPPTALLAEVTGHVTSDEVILVRRAVVVFTVCPLLWSADSASTGASTDPGTFLPSLPPVSLGVNSASTLQTLLATTATALVCTAVALVMK